MKNTLLILLFFVSINMSAQNCVYKRNEIDKFTGSKVIITKPKLLNFGYPEAYSASVKSINENFYLEIGYSGGGIFSIDKGSKLMIMMDNDSIATLESVEYVIADAVTVQGMTSWGATIDYWFPPEEQVKLLKSPVKVVRIYTNDGYIEKEIKKKYKTRIMQAIKCVL